MSSFTYVIVLSVRLMISDVLVGVGYNPQIGTTCMNSLLCIRTMVLRSSYS